MLFIQWQTRQYTSVQSYFVQCLVKSYKFHAYHSVLPEVQERRAELAAALAPCTVCSLIFDEASSPTCKDFLQFALVISCPCLFKTCTPTAQMPSWIDSPATPGLNCGSRGSSAWPGSLQMRELGRVGQAVHAQGFGPRTLRIRKFRSSASVDSVDFSSTLWTSLDASNARFNVYILCALYASVKYEASFQASRSMHIAWSIQMLLFQSQLLGQGAKVDGEVALLARCSAFFSTGRRTLSSCCLVLQPSKPQAFTTEGQLNYSIHIL